MKNTWKRIFIALLLTAIAVIAALAVSNKSAATADQIIYQDTDGNGYPEKYQLLDQQLQVFENHRLIWQSPEDWNIQQIALADADNDQQVELLMVVWKHASFGNSKPFWHKEPDDEYSCHLFLYRLVSGRLKEVWCSSAIINPIMEMRIEKRDRDGLNQLIVSEGPPLGFAYPLRQLFHRQETIWIWDNWGFKIQQKKIYLTEEDSTLPLSPPA